MESPVSTGVEGIKIKPEHMEKEKLYHCIFQEKVLLVFKDSQEVLNCYEIEEKELVKKIKNSGGDDDLEKIFEEYVETYSSETINKTTRKFENSDQMSEENKKPTEAEEILSEFQNSQISKNKKNQNTSIETDVEPSPEPSLEIDKSLESSSNGDILEQVDDNSSKSEKTIVDDKDQTRNVIFVGVKPILTYVTATLTQLSTHPIVTIKARGKRITQAVDVSQMIVKRMNTVGYFISDVRITSDSLQSQDGRERNVSTIEIDVTTK